MTTTDTAAGPALLAEGHPLTISILCTYQDLIKAFNRHMMWQTNVTKYRAGQARGILIDEPKGMPTKNAKHAMYSDAGRLAAMLELDVPRANDMAGIALIIAAATAKIMAR